MTRHHLRADGADRLPPRGRRPAGAAVGVAAGPAGQARSGPRPPGPPRFRLRHRPALPTTARGAGGAAAPRSCAGPARAQLPAMPSRRRRLARHHRLPVPPARRVPAAGPARAVAVAAAGCAAAGSGAMPPVRPPHPPRRRLRCLRQSESRHRLAALPHRQARLRGRHQPRAAHRRRSAAAAAAGGDAVADAAARRVLRLLPSLPLHSPQRRRHRRLRPVPRAPALRRAPRRRRQRWVRSSPRRSSRFAASPKSSAGSANFSLPPKAWKAPAEARPCGWRLQRAASRR